MEQLRFIMDALIDHNPVTGQSELDNLQFPEVYSMYSRLDSDSVVCPSEAYVRQLWNQLLAEEHVHMRIHKSVSKCDRCMELRTYIRKVC